MKVIRETIARGVTRYEHGGGSSQRQPSGGLFDKLILYRC
jgi:hypothetical protein